MSGVTFTAHFRLLFAHLLLQRPLRRLHLQLLSSSPLADETFISFFLIDDRLRESLKNELDALQSIVIACNDIVDRIGIAVGIDKSHHRNAEFVRFCNSDMLAAWIDDDQEAWRFAHRADSGEVAVEFDLLFADIRDHLFLGKSFAACCNSSFRFAQAF